jgi:hypothetical protein
VKLGAYLLAVGLCLAMTQPAIAQSGDAQGKTVYEADFFKTFSPANALQMIQRLPGFQLDSGNTEVRGFAQAAGNVVINGQRPSSKSDNLDTVLSRIPASRVLRIELASGNAFGADYAGKAQVANVILNDDGGLAGNAEVRLEREFTGRVLPRGALSAVYREGPSSFTASVTFQKYSSTEDGFDRRFNLPAGSETEFRDVYSRNTEPFTTTSLGWALEEAPDRSIHINGKANWDKWTLHQASEVFRPTRAGSHVMDSHYTEDHLWRTWEVSGDIARPFAGGAIKLNALATHRHRRNDDELYFVPYTVTPLNGSYQAFNDWRDERVARLAWSRPDLGGWAVELGGEGAFNRLKSDLDLFSVAPGQGRTPVSAPGIYKAVVSEYRGEAFFNAGRKIASNLRLDLGVTFEASRLKVTGDATAQRTLKFFKPKASLDWTPGAWRVQLALKRTVAQLNFGDFVSAASFNTGQVNGGNAELVPQRAWELLLTVDRAILGDGRIKVELGHNRISQVQDRVPTYSGVDSQGRPIPTGFDAPGNIGDGESWIARSNLSMPLGNLGLGGMRLSLFGSYVKTLVRDLYTHENRAFQGNSLFAYTGELRQDLGTFAWSVSMSGNTGFTFFRLGETDTTQNPSPNLSAFVEYRPNARTTVTLGADNLTDSAGKRWRYFYKPDRRTPTPDEGEYRERNGHRTIYLTVKRSFG